jgi:hypothetical protein
MFKTILVDLGRLEDDRLTLRRKARSTSEASPDVGRVAERPTRPVAT